LYFVTADVRQCYDRIDQNRLIRRTRALLRHENYVVQRSMVVRFVQSLRRTRTRFVRAVSSIGGMRQFWHRAQPLVDGLSRAVRTW
jgi:hypothetical protein